MTGPVLSQPADLAFLSHKGRIWIMGVLNATPDSFYADSRTPDVQGALAKAAGMIQEGADVLDIGGESTRPGAAAVPVDEEIARVLPLIDALHSRWPAVPLSIDTQKAEVARVALRQGVAIVNDISAMRHDPEMASVVAQSGCGVVLMHMQGTPQTMQQGPRYEDVIDELKRFFEERLSAARRAGIADEKIVIDPGIGFGKTLEHNLTILKRLSQLKMFGRPILVGLSRKSFLGKILGESAPEGRLEGSLAAALWALQEGAQAVRVHDVGATRNAITIWQQLAQEKA